MTINLSKIGVVTRVGGMALPNNKSSKQTSPIPTPRGSV